MKKKKLITIVFTLVAMFTFSISSEASSPKIMWGKTELKAGQIGKVTILADTAIAYVDEKGNHVRGRVLKAGSEFRVYQYTKDIWGGAYGIGAGEYVLEHSAIKYETPSKAKLALLEAPSTKVMWGKTELKAGQIGKVTILKETTLFKVNNGGEGLEPGLEPIRTLKPNEEYRVYSAKQPLDGYVPMYGLGGGYYIVQNNTMLNGVTVKYETPSKAKLALLNNK
ncbi:hypothetical protein WAX74_11380 [Psychrobacillus sp. FJAT-51614]|uniref:Uncharacterized protein n=1 Tax=Psychrobacillus mangrovi TaxID=3117745 RepID=A0ABU8F5E0_9BACI